jgi:adenosylcobyric acid synthase
LKGLDLNFVETCQDLSMFQAIILPGSKNTRFDLQWLKETGWAEELTAFSRKIGHVTGICGGYQMMGQQVSDPDGLEGTPGNTTGLGLLPIETVLRAPKTTTLTRFSFDGKKGTGYEIHMGHTRRLGGEPMLAITHRNGSSVDEKDGCRVPGTGLTGTYLHGIFDSPSVTRRWLDLIGLVDIPVSDMHGPKSRHRDYGLLAKHMAKNVDMAAIEKLIQP